MTEATRASEHIPVERWTPRPRSLHVAVIITSVRLELCGTHVIGRVYDVTMQLGLQLGYNFWVLRSEILSTMTCAPS